MPLAMLDFWFRGPIGDTLLQVGETLACLATAFVCGWIVGMERETTERPAGLRTNILVCVGAAGFVHLGVLAHARGDLGQTLALGRLIQSVATGIGFLGAGAIFRSKDHVQGVTTAAAIWVVGAAGAAAGAGALVLALLLATVAYVVLRLLHGIEHRFGHGKQRGPK